MGQILRYLFAPFYRQNAVDTTLGEKWQRWIVLKRTAIVAIFLLAEVGIRVITIKLKVRGHTHYHPKDGI